MSISKLPLRKNEPILALLLLESLHCGPAAPADGGDDSPVRSMNTTRGVTNVVCNRYCDGRDPAFAPAERVPVHSNLYGRGFYVHVNDIDAMVWASVEGGQGGDEVWLDRSWDGGRTWADSKLGVTAIPPGRTGWRTLMYNVDDWNTAGIGALRACGKAGDRPEIVCTPWTRSNWNAWDRRTAAATALMMRFDRSTGLFDTGGWWSGANALTAIIDNIHRSRMGSYGYAIPATYDRQVNAAMGHFRNEYLDDTGWWGLTWVAAYDTTGEIRYLNTARADADHMFNHWDSRCGGGVYWTIDHTYKNAITNSLYIQLNAALSKRIPGDTLYRQRALAGWAWFRSTGMLNSSNLVNDGIEFTNCRNNGATTWTYNQGVLINALVQLFKLTGDTTLRATALRIGNAMVQSRELSPGGILREPNGGERDDCGGDGVSFKGAAVRGLGALNTLVGGVYDTYLQRNANVAYTNARDSIDGYGSHWVGPYYATNHACIASALDLLNAAP